LILDNTDYISPTSCNRIHVIKKLGRAQNTSARLFLYIEFIGDNHEKKIGTKVKINIFDKTRTFKKAFLHFLFFPLFLFLIFFAFCLPRIQKIQNKRQIPGRYGTPYREFQSASRLSPTQTLGDRLPIFCQPIF